MKRVVLCLLVTAFLVNACQSNTSDKPHDALAALKSNTPDQKYGTAFWTDQSQRKTDLWQRAFDFCSKPAHQDYPNCAAVLSQTENSNTKRWLGAGTNVPFGLQPLPTDHPSPGK